MPTVSHSNLLVEEARINGYSQPIAVRSFLPEASGIRADKRHVAVAGHDAGGNIATCLAAVARDRGNVCIRAQVLFAPLLDPCMTRIGRYTPQAAPRIDVALIQTFTRTVLTRSSFHETQREYSIHHRRYLGHRSRTRRSPPQPGQQGDHRGAAQGAAR
jgi:acetyl esterase/lipase